MFTRRFQLFATRHCDKTQAKHRFTQGVSQLTQITGSDYVPLLWELIIVLGVEKDALADVAKGGKILRLKERVCFCNDYV
jgi:hypothetical protein